MRWLLGGLIWTLLTILLLVLCGHYMATTGTGVICRKDLVLRCYLIEVSK